MRKTDQSRISYNKKAYDYENTRDGRFTRPLRQLILNTVYVQKGQRILDIACGTGDLLAALARKAPDTHACGIDIADQMIEVARKSNPNITYTVSPAYPLPFGDNSIDIITVSAAFHHFEEPQRFASECIRVLSGGGRLYIGEFSYSTFERVIFNPFLPLLRSGDVRLYSEEELAGFFTKAGFEALGIERSGRCLVLSFEKFV
jgi:ubiquinone/menaquinone biosynthesis C-methylase UbiE